MDEEFHIPQAFAYCEGRFGEWDDKITTFPGLYISALGMTFGLCKSPTVLRMTNAVFLSLLGWILQYHFTKRKGKCFANSIAVEICLHPFVWFYAHLFYTDIGSLLFVILCYVLASEKRMRFSALAGAVAVLFRQNNIVWVFLVAMNQLMDDILMYSKKKEMSLFQSIPKFLFSTRFFKDYSCFVLIGGSFIAFFLYNEGIVLGDKTNHSVCFHFAQVLYLSVALMISSSDAMLSVRFTHISLILFISCFLVPIVHYFTIDHPFLVSDNRHYTFYLWKYFFQGFSLFRYIVTPIYATSIVSTTSLLQKHQTAPRTLIFLLCSMIVLVPSPLLEIRYFIVPCVLFRLMTAQKTYRSTIVTYCMVDFVLLYVFLFRSFEGVDGKTARFMW